MPDVHPRECDPAIDAFIKTRGVTRCPTACAQPTQATLRAADRAALAEHGAQREIRRARRMAAGNRQRRTFGILAPAAD